jgi:hypothetical protein
MVIPRVRPIDSPTQIIYVCSQNPPEAKGHDRDSRDTVHVLGARRSWRRSRELVIARDALTKTPVGESQRQVRVAGRVIPDPTRADV